MLDFSSLLEAEEPLSLTKKVKNNPIGLGCSLVIEWIPGMYKVLGSIPQPRRRNRRRRGRGRERRGERKKRKEQGEEREREGWGRERGKKGGRREAAAIPDWVIFSISVTSST